MKQRKTFRTIGAALMAVILGVGIAIGKFIDNLGVDVLKAKISFHKISVS